MSKKQKKAAKRKAKELERRIAEARARYVGKRERAWVPYDLRPRGRPLTAPKQRPGGWMPYGVVYGPPPPVPDDQRPDPIEL